MAATHLPPSHGRGGVPSPPARDRLTGKAAFQAAGEAALSGKRHSCRFPRWGEASRRAAAPSAKPAINFCMHFVTNFLQFTGFRKSDGYGKILRSGLIGKEHHHEQDRVARRKRLSGTVENRRMPNNWTPVARADFKVDVSSRFPSPVADERTSESGVVAWRGLTSADWTAAFPPPGRDDLPSQGQGNLLRRCGCAMRTGRSSARQSRA